MWIMTYGDVLGISTGVYLLTCYTVEGGRREDAIEGEGEVYCNVLLSTCKSTNEFWDFTIFEGMRKNG